MCASIREFGFKIPCLVRSDGEVVDGHLRLKGARKLGISEIPVIPCDEWTPAQVKAFRLMVNRSVSWADWDENLLGEELLALKDLDFDLGLTGFEDEELRRLLAAQDAAEGLTDENAVPELSWPGWPFSPTFPSSTQRWRAVRQHWPFWWLSARPSPGPELCRLPLQTMCSCSLLERRLPRGHDMNPSGAHKCKLIRS